MCVFEKQTFIWCKIRRETVNTVLSKNFWKSLLYKQNNHHAHGVFVHTCLVVYHLFKMKQYKMIVAGILHDIAKPIVAKPDKKDIERGLGELSFTSHEELGYQIIKKWIFISHYSKMIVRYHYLIRGMNKAKQKGQIAKHARLKRTWDGLSDEMKNDLKLFIKADDLAKK